MRMFAPPSGASSAQIDPPWAKRDLPGEAEADAAAALVGRVEGQEDVLAPILGDARAVVAHLDPAMARRLAREGQARRPDRSTSVVARIALRSRLSSACASSSGSAFRLSVFGSTSSRASIFRSAALRKREAQDLLGPRLRLELAAVDVGRLGKLAIAFDEAEDAFGAARDRLGRGLRVGERSAALCGGRDHLGAGCAQARSPASASS